MKWILFMGLLMSSLSLHARLRLPSLIGDSMILQRDKPLFIWGWNNNAVTVSFAGKSYKAQPDQSGKWEVSLPAMKSGGPYRMDISAADTIIHINDIMIGDVWICSGQSNMELTMNSVLPVFPNDVANSANPYIREFFVPHVYSFTPKDDVPGRWKPASAANTGAFSAVGYYMARALYQQNKVPVGIIHASWGATPAEAWISKQGLNQFDSFVYRANYYSQQSHIDSALKADQKMTDDWFANADRLDSGLTASWFASGYNTANWKKLVFPGTWEAQGLPHYDGVVWVKKEIALTEDMLQQDAWLELGVIEDFDHTWFNGVKVGSSWRYAPRRYRVPASLLKKGKNVITIRIIDTDGTGGFFPRNKYRLLAGGKEIDLAGEWQWQPGVKIESLQRGKQTRMQNQPTALFNAMINPLIHYAIKGAAWYQGEANVGRAAEYQKLLPAVINDWRSHWRQGNFPFLIVQLANYTAPVNIPAKSAWAELREAQLLVSQRVPACGLAVTIDVGEADDIHPLDKKTVGNRLALQARKLALNESRLICSGPLYQSMKINGNTIELSFTGTGSGLVAKGGELQYFAIAGGDEKFLWAKAVIRNNKILVSADQVSHPVAVRYAWAHNPDGCNLYNKEGLPASPFRTDSWPE